MYKKTIENYIPKNNEEAITKKTILQFIEKNDDALSRNNLIAHITTSAFIINKAFTKTVFAYHNIYDAWAWIGGHNDNDDNCLNVAIAEAREETGLITITPVTNEPIMIDILSVDSHYKNGNFIPDHLHLNITYLLFGDELEPLSIKSDENQAVKWINLEDMPLITSETKMRPIYNKGLKRILEIKKGFNQN